MYDGPYSDKACTYWPSSMKSWLANWSLYLMMIVILEYVNYFFTCTNKMLSTCYYAGIMLNILHTQINTDVQIIYSLLNICALTTLTAWNFTICVQIFEACKFRGCHKSSIFAILFSRITKYPALWFMQVKVCPWNFEDKNFADSQFTAKTLKITSLKNLYVYGNSFIHCMWRWINTLFKKCLKVSTFILCLEALLFNHTVKWQALLCVLSRLFPQITVVCVLTKCFHTTFYRYTCKCISIHSVAIARQNIKPCYNASNVWFSKWL